MKKHMAAFLAILILLVVTGAQAATSVVTFPDLPASTDWTSGLETVFIAAAGLGLGILGLRLVIGMIKAGLGSRKARS